MKPLDADANGPGEAGGAGEVDACGARAVSLRSAVLELGARRLATRHGDFRVHFFRDLAEARLSMVLVRGDVSKAEPMLARVHSSCLTSEGLMGRDCDCAEQLDGALAAIARAGRGVLAYLMQEGRGAGLSAKARDRMLVQASGNRITTFDAYAAMGLPTDLRRYEAVASMFALLGVRGPLELLTNNPEKGAAVARVLEAEKIEIAGHVPIGGRRSAFNHDYLHAKRRAGHALERLDGGAGARPPERVVAFEPVVHADDPKRLVTASYFLPIALGETSRTPAIEWFRSTVLVERASGRESIVLSRALAGAPQTTRIPAAGDWIDLELLDRFPVVRAASREALARALRAIVERGSGAVGLRWDETALPTAPSPEIAVEAGE